MALYDSKFRPTAFGMTEEERNKKAAQVPGSVVVTPIARPDARTLGERAGNAYRDVTNAGSAAVESAVNLGMKPSLAAGQFGKDFISGVMGTPRSTAAPLTDMRISTPRFGVSAPPIQTPAPRAGVQPAAPAAIASPSAKPRTAAELNQASQAEVAARTSTQPPAGTPQGAGASQAAGGAAPKPDDPNTYTNGAGVTKRVPMPGTPAAAGTIGSVQSQNFGNAAVPQAPGSIARPGVASTFGMGVNDPRLNDQTPTIARPNAISGAAYRGADQMAEQYNSREDREARNKVLGDIDTALFLARGKPGSEQVMADLLQTKARVAGGAEQLSAEALQNRANRVNEFGIAGLNDAGETARAGIAADTERRGQSLNFDATMAGIARPQYREDKDGNVFSVSGTNATAVARPDGSQLQGRVEQQAQGQQRNFQQESEANLFADLLANQVDATGNPLPNAVDTALAQLQKYKAAQGVGQAAAADPYQDGAIIKGPNGRMRYNAKTNAFEPVK